MPVFLASGFFGRPGLQLHGGAKDNSEARDLSTVTMLSDRRSDFGKAKQVRGKASKKKARNCEGCVKAKSYRLIAFPKATA